LIDVRHPGEIDAKPISLPDNQILCIPFFNLEQRLGELTLKKNIGSIVTRAL
jgi:hypothetical protein